MTVNKIRLRSLADDGNRRAALVLDTTEKHTSKMLSAILIGNNIVNISASSLSATLAYSFGGYMVSIATAILTVAILVSVRSPEEFCHDTCREDFSCLYSDYTLFHVYYDSDHLFDRFYFPEVFIVSASCRSKCQK